MVVSAMQKYHVFQTRFTKFCFVRPNAGQAVAALRFLADDVKDAVDELGAFRVVALGPIVAGASLAEDEIVGAEQLKNLKFG